MNSETWKIESVVSSGDNPGWIYSYRARLNDSGLLVISGAKRCLDSNGEEDHVDNEIEFTLNLLSRIWDRT